MRDERILVVCGPTASGKTALSIALAKMLGGEVVSADSMQLYRGMDIGTAKPTAAEMDGVPHHMLDILEPGEPFSVALYAKRAGEWVEDIRARGKAPIVCGGTGLYIDGLLRGTEFQPLPEDGALRQRLEAQWEQFGAEALLSRLREIDPETGARLHPNDKRRILRALEVYECTGEPLSVHDRRSRAQKPRFTAVRLGLTARERRVLYDRIDRRVDVMLARGLEEEVRRLQTAGKLTGTAAQAIGYKEFAEYFAGERTLEETADLIRQKSRNYAKRQLTWFRRDPGVHWIELEENEGAAEALQKATNFLQAEAYNGGE